jgi:hypothetical protein
MSMTYTGEVFFGAFVERDTPIGKKLAKYIDKAGGTPAETETPGVEVSDVGSSPTGETWMVVHAANSGHRFSRYDDVKAPVMLTEDPAWRPSIAAFFARLKIKDPPPVGWHFAGSVS